MRSYEVIDCKHNRDIEVGSPLRLRQSGRDHTDRERDRDKNTETERDGRDHLEM